MKRAQAETLPSLSDLLSITCFAEIARRSGVSRQRIFRFRHNGWLPDDALIEPLAAALYRSPDYIRAVVEADRKRKEAS